MWGWQLMPGDSSSPDPDAAGTFELIHGTAGDPALTAGSSASFEASTAHT
jgi:hypothetical protein